MRTEGSDRGARLRAVCDALVMLATLIITRAVCRAAGLQFGAGSVATVAALLVATVLLRRRGLTWRDLGVRAPERPERAVMVGVGLLFTAEIVVPPLAILLASWLHLPAQGREAQVFGFLRGDPWLLFVMLVPVGWGGAAFGEEMLHRAFLATRLELALGGGRVATVASAVLQAAGFGLLHAYLGPAAVLKAGLLGLASSIAYFSFGRNLWPLIIVHGVVDSIGLIALYLGAA